MKVERYFILFVTASLILLNTGLSLAQEETTAKPAPESATEQAPASTAVEPEVQWLWGEAVSVDMANKTLLVKYLDYETDSEKEISMNIDDKTTYENVKSIDEIKPQDTLSIDYIVSPEGKNIAKNISVEKSESSPVLQEGTAAGEQKVAPVTPTEEPKEAEPGTE